jgi:uncharacterized protein (TIGR03083 family)
MTDFDDREQAAFERTVALFRDADPGLAVTDGSWTTRDVLAHLVTVARRYTSMPRLADTPREVDTINAEELAELADATVEALLDDYAQGFARYREVWVPMAAEHQWPFHGGGRIGTTSLRANWLGEMLVHGYDVAAAAGVDWPIGDADAGDLLGLLRDILPAYGRAGTEAVTVDLALDGVPPWTLAAGAVPEGDAAAPEATVTGPAGVGVLFLYQRLSPVEARARGLRVEGDESVLARLLECVERP